MLSEAQTKTKWTAEVFSGKISSFNRRIVLKWHISVVSAGDEISISSKKRFITLTPARGQICMH